MVKAFNSARTKSTTEPYSVNTSMYDHKSVVVPFKKLLNKHQVTPAFSNWRDAEKPNVSYMVSEFERKKAADVNKRVRVDKTGVLNMTGIHRYKYSDDIFKRQDVIPEGKNHGLMFLLDWSSSMNAYIHETVKQLLVLTMFCRMTNIPFDVYIFQSGGNSLRINENRVSLDSTAMNMMHSSFSLKNILSSRMTASEYLRMSSFMFEMSGSIKSYNHGPWSMGSTPLISSLEVFPDIVNDFIKLYKVQVPSVFILTDGESDIPILSSSRLNNGVTINNPITRKSYSADASASSILGAMLENLKDMTNSRIVGIHLKANAYDVDKKGFVINSVRGYDKHYTVPTSNMTMMNRNVFWSKVKDNLSQTDLSDALTEYAKQKNSSRFILRSFIDDISLDRSM